jgi:type II secretory pathway component PulK
MTGQRGFALLAVMLVLTLLGVIIMEFSFSMRLEASMVRSYKENLLARHLAEAGIHHAIREILSQASTQAVDDQGTLVFYRTSSDPATPTRLPTLQQHRIALGPGEFSYQITDEEARLNLNTASPDVLEHLLEVLGMGKQDRDIITDSLQDWKDADDLHRTNGAESEDHYLTLPVPYRARNGLLQDPRELLQIRGITRDLYFGNGDRSGLESLVTVFGRNALNLNSAPAPVLHAVGLSEAEIADITQTRIRIPYTIVPGRFAGRGLGVGSATFRIEAEGWIAGALKSRVEAVVQRRGPQPTTGATQLTALGVAVLSWRSTSGR